MPKHNSANCPTCGQHWLKPDEAPTIVVPLTYDELSNVIEALQWEMRESKDTDFQGLIDKLEGYHRL